MIVILSFNENYENFEFQNLKWSKCIIRVTPVMEKIPKNYYKLINMH